MNWKDEIYEMRRKFCKELNKEKFVWCNLIEIGHHALWTVTSKKIRELYKTFYADKPDEQAGIGIYYGEEHDILIGGIPDLRIERQGRLLVGKLCFNKYNMVEELKAKNMFPALEIWKHEDNVRYIHCVHFVQKSVLKYENVGSDR